MKIWLCELWSHDSTVGGELNRRFTCCRAVVSDCAKTGNSICSKDALKPRGLSAGIGRRREMVRRLTATCNHWQGTP